QQGVEITGHVENPAVRQQDRTAEQAERPAAERDRSLVFVSEHLICRGRRAEKESRLRRREETAVENDAARKEEHDGQRQKKHVEQRTDNPAGKRNLLCLKTAKTPDANRKD